ncbi:MAG: DNA-directed RNA polymerase subunit omega [Cyanobacteria bacterium]|uniref:DNA-directed RNA polymerase subunit omega n=1 Tax=Geminocystis sp. TaxID=2664100 RepID=UPI001D3C0C81|nr:DNA-directed RNA polymerase subunit omega [Cyanobacteria bacterium CG_2015-16_32_12]NCO77733.1 DNA-directed RNA polymerase subunit omega [Cyanobacteria bacterium CG_2015-22_32_23]NCQ03036.1 DNA-directed RNA polymerase subunit omega [Cyanobacteria bacterium CG_2015-09_32_10]NCQ41709.1 DNA-directed RNA polymerase subunit omega [Cyanobacteria bacterium CG_2015-04_32_10]NCS83589.1 DNA-directed RNA polymerase subunit omega [Cyanobacteria bacterium CG_2015-02_32_10]
MLKKSGFDTSQIMFRSDELMNAASNRYKITVAVAKRAKQRRKEDWENIEEVMKPVLRAIIEMSDELTQPEIISDD